MPPNVNTLSTILEKMAYLEAQNTAKETRIASLEAVTAMQAKTIEALRADVDAIREAASGLGVRVTAMETKKAKGK